MPLWYDDRITTGGRNLPAPQPTTHKETIMQRIELDRDVSGVHVLLYTHNGKYVRLQSCQPEMDAVRFAVSAASPAFPFLYFGIKTAGDDQDADRIIGWALYSNGHPLRDCEGDMQHTGWLEANAAEADADRPAR